MMDSIQIIKIGGKVITDPKKLSLALEAFASIKGAKILVHGGGTEASKLAERMSVPVQMIDGRRITDEAMLDIVVKVYAGSVNKSIVSKLQSLSVNALGLSGADGNIILSHRRPVQQIDYGHVGDIDNVNGSAIYKLLAAGFIPVICPLTHDGNGNLLNTNADTIASSVAKEMSKASDNTRLIYTFELEGVLKDVSDSKSVVAKINPTVLAELERNKIISQGMIPKIENAMRASKEGVHEVFICHYAKMNEPNSGSEINCV